jgi:hypothetical protein
VVTLPSLAADAALRNITTFLCYLNNSYRRSVQGRLSCRQRGQHIPPRTLARKDDGVHFVFRDPWVPKRAFNVTGACRLVPIVGE